MERVSATGLVREAARRLGWQTEVLDEYGYLFEVRAGARRRVLLGGRSPLNDAVAARLAEDKHYAGVLLARAGLEVPRTVRCLSPAHPSLHRYRDRAGLGPAEALARELGYPLVVKPNRLSHGRGVRLVEDGEAMREAVREAWRLDAIALAQEVVEGRDFRLDFLDGEYLLGYERRPIVLRGDGASSVAELLEALDPRFDEAGRERLLRVPWVAGALEARGWSLGSTPEVGETLEIESPIKNLRGGCTATYLPRIPEGLRRRCVRAAEALGLRHFGVDLKLESLEAAPERAVFIEINASPLLTQIGRIGHLEEAIAAQVRVLTAILEG